MDGVEAGQRKGGLVGARRDWNWNRGSLPARSSSEVAEDVESAGAMALNDGRQLWRRRSAGVLVEEGGGGGKGSWWLREGRSAGG